MAYNQTKFPCISNKKSNRSELGRGVSGYFFLTLQNMWESLIREKRNYNPGQNTWNKILGTKYLEQNTWKKILGIKYLEQNTWNKIEKSSKTGKERKSLISTFACFLTAIAKV